VKATLLASHASSDTGDKILFDTLPKEKWKVCMISRRSETMAGNLLASKNSINPSNEREADGAESRMHTFALPGWDAGKEQATF